MLDGFLEIVIHIVEFYSYIPEEIRMAAGFHNEAANAIFMHLLYLFP